MARISYYTRDSLLDCIMSQLFDSKGKRRTYRNICNSVKTRKLTRWTAKNCLGSFSQALKTHGINEMTLYEESRARGLIPLSMTFQSFSGNKKLDYNDSNKNDLNKPIQKTNFLKELLFRLGIEIDCSLVAEKDIYDFIYAMGYTEEDVKIVEDEIRNIKYKPTKEI